MKVLNLYAGIGGNRKLWEDVEVTAVELNPQIAEVYSSFYPKDEMIIGDAHEYLLAHYKEFDFVWSSPPCQSHSRMNKFTRHNTVRYAGMELYQEILLLQSYFKGLYVVENVVPYYKPLIEAQKIGRHLFWSNFQITPMYNVVKSPKNFTKLATVESKKVMMDWLGLHYEKNIYYGNNHCPVQILRNAVHPLIGQHVFECGINSTSSTPLAQPELFTI